MTRIVLKHLSGSRAGQVNEFPLAQFPEITLGRDPASSLAYDADKDDLVGRAHAKITPDAAQPGQFVVSDQHSRNGTFLNKQRIIGAARITPGDVIQLGAGGPELQFDLAPRPANFVQATRESGAAFAPSETAPFPPPTKDSAAPSGPVRRFSSAPPASPIHVPTTNVNKQDGRVGKATVERMISQTRRDVGKLMLFGGGALMLILALALWKFWPRAATSVTTFVSAADPNILTPGQVAEKYSNAVVSIDVRWKLINTNTGGQVFHVYVPNLWKAKDGKVYPIVNNGRPEVAVYTVLDDKTYEPALDSSGAHAIGGGGSGTGFVVSSDGFLFTARHVGAGWMSRYQYPEDASPGVIGTQLPNRKWLLRTNPDTGMPITYRIPTSWVPSETKQLGRDGYRWAVEGRLDYLSVTFPNNKTSIPGKLARVSDRHDVAMLKIDMPGSMPTVQIYDNYDTIKVGEPITVLGYPAVSPISWGLVSSMDVFNRETQVKVIPDPSLTTGNIGRVLRSKDSSGVTGKDKTTNEMGDAYQVTASPGAGNSGGPVFDDHGRVIGIYYAGRTLGSGASGQVSFAVPIRFASELMTTTPK